MDDIIIRMAVNAAVKETGRNIARDLMNIAEKIDPSISACDALNACADKILEMIKDHE